MFVHHPYFEVGRPDTTCNSSWGTRYHSTRTNARSCLASLIINAVYATLFILPRPVEGKIELPPLPTSNQPFWRPSSYIFRRIGMTDAAIESAIRSQSMRRPLKQMAQQLRIPEDWLRINRYEGAFISLNWIDQAFDEAICNAEKNQLNTEYALSRSLVGTSNNIVYDCRCASSSLGNAMAAMITSMAEKHKRLCSLPATMPFERMRTLV